jgi:hypothetical protein
MPGFGFTHFPFPLPSKIEIVPGTRFSPLPETSSPEAPFSMKLTTKLATKFKRRNLRQAKEVKMEPEQTLSEKKQHGQFATSLAAISETPSPHEKVSAGILSA